ncbi:MAG: GntR family transcriptional regulator [Enterocloster sp.]
MKKYEKVKEYLLERILDGTYVPDLPIPPERELASLLDVNRMTVRRAVEELMYDGYLIRKKEAVRILPEKKCVRTNSLQQEKKKKIRRSV